MKKNIKYIGYKGSVLFDGQKYLYGLFSTKDGELICLEDINFSSFISLETNRIYHVLGELKNEHIILDFDKQQYMIRIIRYKDFLESLLGHKNAFPEDFLHTAFKNVSKVINKNVQKNITERIFWKNKIHHTKI